MTLVDKMAIHMDSMEELGHTISTTSNTKILSSYYSSLGVSGSTSFSIWMNGIAEGKLPPYSSVTRAVRACRVANPEWRKKRKQQEVDYAKADVGY